MRGGGVHYSMQGLVAGTLALPLFAFISCVIYSLTFDFDYKGSTHCEVDEFLPSLSSVIGDNIPQKYVWNICIAIHSAPRFLFAALNRNILQERLNCCGAWTPLIKLNYLCNVLENICLVGLSFVASTEIFIIHKICFITFLATYMGSLVITAGLLLPRCGYQAKNRAEQKSYRYKRFILKASFVCLIAAGYFYYRHNEYCEPYVYSFFGLFEYLVILMNMWYHGLSYYDFQEFTITAGPNQILVR